MTSLKIHLLYKLYKFQNNVQENLGDINLNINPFKFLTYFNF